MNHIVLPKRVQQRDTDKRAPVRHKETDQETASEESGLFSVPDEFHHIQPDMNREIQYEYLDNTADIQIHSWGTTLQEAMEMAALGLYGYITDAPSIEYDGRPISIFAEGNDLQSLLFQFLSNYLNAFCVHGRLCNDIKIVECDLRNFRVRSLGFGETFQPAKHPQGTEIKAITYSNMQITTRKLRTDIYVIVDI